MTRLDDGQKATLASVPRDGEPPDVGHPGLGAYRVTYKSGANDDFLVGLPAAKARSTLSTLIVVEVGGVAAGLVTAELPLPSDEVAK